MATLTAAVLVANGFEDIEAVSPIDILRRAGFKVDVIGVNGTEATGGSGTVLKTEIPIASAKTKEYDVIVLPGGLQGAKNLALSSDVVEMLKAQKAANRWIAAICASPALVLCANSLMGSSKGVCYPSMTEEMGDNFAGKDIAVHVDGKFITSCGPATCMAWCLTIAREVDSAEKADEVAGRLLFKCKC